MSPSTFPALLDREIDNAVKDSFGHRHYAEALVSLITDPETKSSCSIGLLGRWGTGKSSIKAMTERTLADRHRDHEVITFNAWRYGSGDGKQSGTDMRRALLRHTFKALNGDESKIDDALYNSVQSREERARTPLDIGKELYQKVPWTLAQFLAFLAILLGFFWFVHLIVQPADPITAAALLGGLGVIAFAAFKYLLDFNRLFIPRYTTITRTESPRTSAEVYEDYLQQQITVFKDTEKNKPRNLRRLVIFVDDLDRLSAGEMVDGLDAIRTFMEMNSKLETIFVVSADEGLVAEAIASRRRSESPAGVHTAAEARRYLDRIFQHRLEIPPFPKRDMRDYAQNRIDTELTLVAQQIATAGSSTAEIVERLIHPRVSTPRTAVQLVNAFCQMWWLAHRRERDGNNPSARGGLTKDLLTKEPLAMAIIAGLRVEFPDFFGALQLNYALLQDATRILVNGASLKDIPEPSRVILEAMYEPGSDPPQLKSAFRPLRDHLSFIQSTPLPANLQPFLLLSDDPVTRKFGNRAVAVQTALASGSDAGVLEALGRSNDTLPLDADEIKLLKGIEEELGSSAADRENATVALARLRQRFPPREAALLVKPIADNLTRSERVRWRVGAPALRALLPTFGVAEQQAVGGCLIGDLTADKFPWRLSGGDVPDASQAATIVEELVEIALTVRATHGLEKGADTGILDWLLERAVRTQKDPTTLPFAKLEEIMVSHEPHLLRTLGERYVDAVLGEIRAERTEGWNVDLAIARVLRFVETLFGAEAGQEGQALRKRLLAAALDPKVAVVHGAVVGWIRQRLGTLDPGTLNAVVGAGFDAENDEAVQTSIQEFVLQRPTDLDNSVAQGLRHRVVTVCERADQVEIGLRLFDVLYKVDVNEAIDIVATWMRTPWTLEERVMARVAQLLDEVAVNDRQVLLNEFTTYLSSGSVEEGKAAAFATFARCVRLEHLNDNSGGRAFVTAVFQLFSNSFYATQTWLEAHCAAIARIAPVLDDATIGFGIGNALAQSAANYPLCHGAIHAGFVNHWKDLGLTSSSLSNPRTIFPNGTNFITNYRTNPTSVHVYRSLDELVNLDLLTAGDFVEPGLKVWAMDPSSVAQVLDKYAQGISSVGLTELVNGVRTERDGDLEALRKVFARYVASHGSDDLIGDTRTVLEAAVLDEDAALASWVLCMVENHMTAILQTLHPPTSPDNARRLWQQLAPMSMGFDTAQLNDLFEAGFVGQPDLGENVIRVRDDLTRTYGNNATLASQLLGLLKRTPSHQRAVDLAMWVANLKVPRVLQTNRAVLDGVSDDYIDILETHFAGEKATLKNLRAGK
jgi:hypothetical protein